MLSSIGINSYFTTNKKKDVKFENGTYECKESYDINISTDRLNKILDYADTDRVRKLATPRNNETIPLAKVGRIKTMLGKGYSYSEIAEATGVSVSTIHTISE